MDTASSRVPAFNYRPSQHVKGTRYTSWDAQTRNMHSIRHEQLVLLWGASVLLSHASEISPQCFFPRSCFLFLFIRVLCLPGLLQTDLTGSLWSGGDVSSFQFDSIDLDYEHLLIISVIEYQIPQLVPRLWNVSSCFYEHSNLLSNT